MCLNVWNSIIFVCVPKGIIMVLEQCLPRPIASLLCFWSRLHSATERLQPPGHPVTPAVLRDTVKDIFCIYNLKVDERSACFVSHVVGRSNAAFVHISVSSFRCKQFGWAVMEKHLRMWRMWDQSITFPRQASLDTTFHTTIKKITWAPWWLFTLWNHKVSLFLWY